MVPSSGSELWWGAEVPVLGTGTEGSKREKEGSEGPPSLLGGVERGGGGTMPTRTSPLGSWTIHSYVMSYRWSRAHEFALGSSVVDAHRRPRRTLVIARV